MKSQNKHCTPQSRAPSRKQQVKPNQKKKHQDDVRRSAASSSSPLAAVATLQHAVPVKFQQAILDVFTQAFPVTSQPHVFQRTAQEVKGHLYRRDFSEAFGRPEYLNVYAARWSAARALAYADIFTQPDHHAWFQPLKGQSNSLAEKVSSENVDDVTEERVVQSTVTELAPRLKEDVNTELPADEFASLSIQPTSETSEKAAELSKAHTPALTGSQLQVRPQEVLKIACIGGGAGAEVVALAAAIRHLHCESNTRHGESESNHQSPQSSTVPAIPAHLEVLVIDIADWSRPVEDLSAAIRTPPTLSPYASQSVRENTRALIDVKDDGIETLKINFEQRDILQSTPTMLGTALQNVTTVTIMFTLNELFTTSLPETTALLLKLTEAMEIGAYLVVVDSPGSYSEIQLGKSEEDRDPTTKPTKRYPMKWLLDHTLLQAARMGGSKGLDKTVDRTTVANARWTKIEDNDSKWFRIDGGSGLKYGVDLENCRYQIHVFRKLR